MPANNLRQAQVPVGARTMDQQPGTAPGLICPIGDSETGQVIYAVPGVPYEMQEMVAGTVIPDLQRRAGVSAVIRSRTLRTWGMSESGLAEVLADRIVELDETGHATIAFLASGIEGIKVRLTVKAPTRDEASALLSREETAIRELLGPVVFGADDEGMEAAVGKLLVEEGWTLGVAESLTGGLVGSRLSQVPGASDWFRGAIVAYASDVKRKLLGVGDGPVVSETAAEEMALGAASTLGADVGIALTGVAGPTEQEGQPVGTVWIGLAIDGVSEARLFQLGGDREQIRQIATISALDLLRRRLLDGSGAG
jgi:nicotinamide-nucleotide amidase